MITLYGFAVSNYYNRVKLALMEKGIPFTEELVYTAKDAMKQGSPIGKIPFIKTEEGQILSESAVILEYLEDRYPEKLLLPKDPYAAAKVRELATFIDLYLELPARELYLEAFFGGKLSDEVKATAESRLKRGIAGFAKMALFSPYVAGEQFTLADCAAIVHLPLVSLATTRIYGKDFLAETPAREYVKAVNQMPSMQKINADRKANQALMLSLRSAK